MMGMNAPQKQLPWEMECLCFVGRLHVAKARAKDCQSRLCKKPFICFVGVFLLCKHVLRPTYLYMFYNVGL